MSAEKTSTSEKLGIAALWLFFISLWIEDKLTTCCLVSFLIAVFIVTILSAFGSDILLLLK
jgi:hypothetical protein